MPYYTFTMKRSDFQKRRAFVSDNVEHGGNFSIDLDKKEICGEVERKGQYAQVNIVRGIMDWHSHPMNCLNDSKCALGLPSPQDITSIFAGHMYGSVGHFVFASEGTYFINFDHKLINEMKCDLVRAEKYTKLLTSLSDDLHAHFLASEFDYDDYRSYWMEIMFIHGVHCHFFHKNTRPKVKVFIDQKVTKPVLRGHKKSHKLYQTITIPSDISKDAALCPARR